jgi:AGZA family xanthine/uracil permease-like MFS transporter
MTVSSPPWFVRKDLDGFFGLMIDNLIQLILVVSLCRELIHLPDSYIFGRILPGAAISILVGNFFYSWQARQLTRESGREDVTALPYGINTVSLFAYVFFIMLPIYQETKDPIWAWKVGLVACFLSGMIEVAGAFIAESVRRITPRAALLSALAGIAITFISMDFSFRIFAHPLIAMVPMALILLSYFSHQRFPLGLPGGLVAILVGRTGLGWGLGTMSEKQWSVGFTLAFPVWTGGSLWEALSHPAFLNYLSVILPMGIFNVVGSLQNIESAEAAGDRYRTFPSLMANGIGSVVASLFGSAFPTTIYIGHPGWKRLGARSGYSALNGIFITFLCLTGTIQTVLNVIPLEAGIGILLYIGIIIVAQSFQETPKEHAPAVALGLFPALAAWGLLMVETGLKAAGKSLYEAGLAPFAQSLAINGMISLERGFIFTSMILAAIGVFLIEREFFRAAFWSLAAAFFAAGGIIHAYELTPGGVATRFSFLAAPEFVASYLLLFVLFLAVGWWEKKRIGY